MTSNNCIEKRPKILVVEDNLLNQRVVELYLEELSYNSVVASTAAEAFILIETERFDLILLDIGLPDMDGIEVVRRLALAGCPIPIIAVSAHADDQAAEIINAGASTYLPKPFSIDQLGKAIKELIGV